MCSTGGWAKPIGLRKVFQSPFQPDDSSPQEIIAIPMKNINFEMDSLTEITALDSTAFDNSR
jgi:hypothetical protein